MARLAVVSIDLDPLQHYCAIHGLGSDLLSADANGAVARAALPRLLELLASVPGTLFVIGAEAAEPSMVAQLKRAVEQGWELGNHSFAHSYEMSTWTKAAITEDVRRADAALRAIGATPCGFRAPGYNLSPQLLQVVASLDYQYDASAFSSPPYWVAKAAVMGGLALRGRPSRAKLGDPRAMLAPTTPYRPALAAPYRRGDAAIVELPMSVAPVTRLPFIGTFATTLPWWLVRSTFATMRARDFFSFELHAIDFLDASDGAPAELVAAQPDLRVPVAEKLRRLKAVVGWLRDGWEICTMQRAAAALAPTL